MELALAATARSIAIGQPFNRHITIHCQKIGITSETVHAFITGFFHHVGDFYRDNGHAYLAYLWILENPPFQDGGSGRGDVGDVGDVGDGGGDGHAGNGDGDRRAGGGLHLHILIHIPDELWDRFKVRQRRWLQQSCAVPKRGGLLSTPVRFYRGDERDYLHAGLYGVLRYLFKGLDPKFCGAYGINHVPQGWISGKRFGHAEILSHSRADLEGHEDPENPGIWLSTPDIVAQRMMSGFRKSLDD